MNALNLPGWSRVAAACALALSLGTAPALAAPDDPAGYTISLSPGQGLQVERDTADRDPANDGVAADDEEIDELREEMRLLKEELRMLRESVGEAPEPPEPAEAPEPPEAPEAPEAPTPPAAPTPPTPPTPAVAPPAPGDKAKELISFGDPLRVGKDEVVAEVVSFGGPILVEGHVLGDAVSFGGPVRIRSGAVVDGDAVSFGGQVDVEDGAIVRGDRVNMAGGGPFGPFTSKGHWQFDPEIEIDMDDLVEGETQRAMDEHMHWRRESDHRTPFGNFMQGLFNKLIFLLSFAGAGVLVVGLFPDRVGRVARGIVDHPVRSAVAGVLLTLGISVASVMFAITVLGLPVGVLLVALLGLAWLLGFVGLCQAVGDRLPFRQKQHGRWLAFLGGVLLVSFIGALPFIGWLTVFMVSLLGIGAAFTTKFGSEPG